MQALTPQGGRPLFQTASTTLTSTSAEGVNAVALKNPTREPFEIRELRFSLVADTNHITGAAVGVKLTLGNQPLTKEHTPVWSLGRMVSRETDSARFYQWKLAHPLYVPGDGVLVPEFQNRGMADIPIDVRVSYVGRVLPKGYVPQRTWLPWVTSYTSKVFDAKGADADSSSETDIINPHQSPIHIERLMGRVNCYRQYSGAEFYDEISRHMLAVRIANSRGEPIVRTAQSFDQVFGHEGRCWEPRGGIIEPGGFWSIYMDKLDSPVYWEGSKIQAFVSCMGWREVELTGGAQ